MSTYKETGTVSIYPWDPPQNLWEMVTATSAIHNELFNPEDPDDLDFSLRILLTTIISQPPQEVTRILETHPDHIRILNIQGQLNSPETHLQGIQELNTLFKEYRQDYHQRIKEAQPILH
jgi:hypothetical protein